MKHETHPLLHYLLPETKEYAIQNKLILQQKHAKCAA